MIMVFIVVCVRLLLEVSPPADILQALRRVPDLNKAHGLQGRRDGREVSVLWTSWGAGQAVVLTDPIHWGPGPGGTVAPAQSSQDLLPFGSILGSPASFHTKSLCSFQVRCEFSGPQIGPFSPPHLHSSLHPIRHLLCAGLGQEANAMWTAP